MSTQKVVIADDHPVVLEGMKLLFSHRSDLEVVGTANTLEKAESLCAEALPQVLILDINFQGKNSLDVIARFKNRFPNLKILIFSSYDTPGIVKRALQSDIHGYVLKDAPYSEWMNAIDTVIDGGIYLSAQLKKTQPTFSLKKVEDDVFDRIQRLSKREVEIVQCIVDGKKEQEIADLLSISKNTVHTHKKNILKKLQLHSNAEIVRFAFEHKLFSRISV